MVVVLSSPPLRVGLGLLLLEVCRARWREASMSVNAGEARGDGRNGSTGITWNASSTSPRSSAKHDVVAAIDETMVANFNSRWTRGEQVLLGEKKLTALGRALNWSA